MIDDTVEIRRTYKCINRGCGYARIPLWWTRYSTDLCQRCYQRTYGLTPGVEPVCIEARCTNTYSIDGYCEAHYEIEMRIDSRPSPDRFPSKSRSSLRE